MSKEEIVKTLIEYYDIIITNLSKFVPLTALLGLVTKISLDLKNRKITFLESILYLLVGFGVACISTPIVEEITSNDRFKGGYCFLIGFFSYEVVKWLTKDGRVEVWLDLANEKLKNFFKNKK